MNKFFLALCVSSVAVLSSCSSKMGALSSDNFTVTPNPLEVHSAQVPATINGNFPEKYLKKKAVVTVTPVLRYQGGEKKSSSATFQGEAVMGNDQTISYLTGGHYTMRANFPYEEAMLKSDLYLTFQARLGKKVVNIPDVKIAEGCIATSQLLSRTLASATPSYGQDAFQRSIEAKQTATIQFLLGQANLRPSELNSQNVKQFIEKLKEIQNNPDTNVLNSVEISAYASPDGRYDFNEKLAGKREAVSSDYVKKALKANSLETYVDGKYTAEDWEGFQELVAQSNLQDKDLIIRVLSMYTDPEEREREIKNIATVYKDLADGILPQLRRARITANYEIIGRDDDQILAQFKADARELSVEELIYAATLVDKAAEKEAIYKKTTEIYPKDSRAYTNLGAIAYEQGNLDTAANYFAQALKINPSDGEANANLGLISLVNGKYQDATQYIAKGGKANNLKEALGSLSIAQAQYAQAAQQLSGSKSNTAALAQILAKDYTSATATLSSIKNADATTSYLKAVLAARSGDTANNVSSYLADAIKKDASLKMRAASDLEFAAYAAQLKSLLK